jgi:zinc protease
MQTQALHATTAAASTASRIKSITTPAGITVWHVEDYTVPLVALEFAFIGGSVQEESEKAGTLHMLAGLFDEGAGDLDSQQFQEKLEEKAIELSFSSSREALRGSLRTLVKNTADAFAMLRLAVNEARLDEDAIQRVRAQIIAGIKRDEFDPDSMAARRWFELAFPGHPYGREDRGTHKSVAAIRRSDLVGLRSKLMSKEALRIAVVGAIDEKSLARLIDDVFGALPGKTELAAIAEASLHGLGSLHVIPLDVPQSTIRFGMQGPKRKDADFVSKFVVNHILGGGSFQARLFKEVREKRGLAYSVFSSLYPMSFAGIAFGGTATKNERAKESIDVIREEIAKMAEKGPDDAELAKAVSYLTGSYALRFDTSGKIANQLVQIQVDDLGIDYPDRRNDEIRAVGMAEAKAAARDMLSDGRLLVTVVGKPVGLQ